MATVTVVLTHLMIQGPAAELPRHAPLPPARLASSMRLTPPQSQMNRPLTVRTLIHLYTCILRTILQGCMCGGRRRGEQRGRLPSPFLPHPLETCILSQLDYRAFVGPIINVHVQLYIWAYIIVGRYGWPGHSHICNTTQKA